MDQSNTKHQINHYTYSDALIRQPGELGYLNNNNKIQCVQITYRKYRLEIQVGNLLPFLKIGATLARVHSAGKSPVFRDCQKIRCKTGASSRARFWSILPGIQSGPEALLTSILSRSLKTPNSVIFKSLIEGKVTPGNCN